MKQANLKYAKLVNLIFPNDFIRRPDLQENQSINSVWFK